LIANILAHLIFQFPLFHALIFSVANLIEVLIAAVCLAGNQPGRPDFTQWKVLLRFLLFGILLAPLGSIAVVYMGRLIEGQPVNLLAYWNWYSGDMLGIAIMTPMVLAIHVRELEKLFRRSRFVETTASLLVLTALSVAIFGQSNYPVAFVLFPAMLLLTVRMRSSGAALGIFLIAVPAVYFTSQGRGPFSLLRDGTLLHKITLVQCFLCLLLVKVYAVSAMLAQRDRLQNELRDAFREASGRAATDQVTGIANRWAFEREISREWNRGIREHGSLSLLMIDIDYFKAYNDRYGHLAGDQCLRSVASLLSFSMVRSTDLVVRYGGEEFAVILPGSHAESAQTIARRIHDTILQAQIEHASSKEGIVTVSIGVATISPAPEGSEKELIKIADEALYRAKQGGRNQVCS
jgi:diguanylate cyclase (GGDEF)-like protein